MASARARLGGKWHQVAQGDPSSFCNGLPTSTPNESACLLPQRYRSVRIGLNVAPRAVSTYERRDFDIAELSRVTNPERCKSLSRSERTLSLKPGSNCRSSP